MKWGLAADSDLRQELLEDGGVADRLDGVVGQAAADVGCSIARRRHLDTLACRALVAARLGEEANGDDGGRADGELFGAHGFPFFSSYAWHAYTQLILYIKPIISQG